MKNPRFRGGLPAAALILAMTLGGTRVVAQQIIMKGQYGMMAGTMGAPGDLRRCLRVLLHGE